MRRVKLILQQNCPGLGFVGDLVEVRGGYARNYLLPQGLAFEASDLTKGFAKHKLSQITTKKIRLKSEAEGLQKSIEGLIPEFTLRVGDSGKSFGSISNRDIAKWLDEKGYALDKSQIIINEPIKKVGEHFVKVQLHSEVVTQIKVRVNPEAQPAKVEAAAKPARKGRGGRSREPAGDQESATTEEAASSAE